MPAKLQTTISFDSAHVEILPSSIADDDQQYRLELKWRKGQTVNINGFKVTTTEPTTGYIYFKGKRR